MGVPPLAMANKRYPLAPVGGVAVDVKVTTPLPQRDWFEKCVPNVGVAIAWFTVAVAIVRVVLGQPAATVSK